MELVIKGMKVRYGGKRGRNYIYNLFQAFLRKLSKNYKIEVLEANYAISIAFPIKIMIEFFKKFDSKFLL
ncbi:hypothetical protein PB1_04920 [Bacillus methanolicus PB1]|uniref:Uncharacterized protein n=1 Tax=Bacillus methanolicus PB1 TaxID=997296 RepID=I3E6X5_BACMT|nr:hypothetical protein [Bacillus methanolicus]EIJ82246.1 hypothetical protein PB1_04920 [Bacillus methanolicus PB1]